MFVGVKYYKSFGGYGGRDYVYETELPLAVGDLVIAPTVNEPRQKAMVTAVDLPRPAFQCREITEYDLSEPAEQGWTNGRDF